MSDVRQIAQALIDDTYACPAAILVAFVNDPHLVVLRQHMGHLGTLERRGCFAFGEVTPFGQHVAMVLRNVHGVLAWPR